MNWGKNGADYFMSHLIGEETTHVRAALREYLGRDKTDIVMIHPRMSENTSNQRVPYDVPGYTALDLSPLSGMGTGSGDANEKMRGTVIFNAERFSRSNSAVDTIPLSSDKSFTNCVAFVAELVEKDTGAKVKVVSAYVSKTNGVENAGGVVEQGFSALFSKLDAMKDERVILLFQGDTWGTCDWMERRVNSALADFANYFVEAEGLDWTNRLFTVSGLAPGTEVTLTISTPSGATIASAVQTADSNGNASFSSVTIPGALHDYTLSANGETIASGSFLAGTWDAEGAWFSAAPDGNGGSIERGGAWTLPPEETNATAYVVGAATDFTLEASASAAGTGKVIRAISALRYDFLNDASDTFSDLALGDSLAAITAVNGVGGTAQWKACVGGEWIALSGASAPAPDTDYLVRLEGDFTSATPRVRLSVSDNGGASYAVLSSATTGDEWLVPNNAAATAFTGIATDGAGNVAALRGQLSNAWVAEAGGVRYASLADALRAAGRGGTVTLLTSATAPASLAAGRTIINNGHVLLTYNDWRGTLLFLP